MTTDTTTPDVAGLVERLDIVEAERDYLKCQLEHLGELNEQYYGVLEALKNIERLPSPIVLKALGLAGSPGDWERGKELQAELGHAAIPPVSECEVGAGFWNRLRTLSDKLARVEEEAKKVCDSYAAENQRLYDRAESAEAKLAALSVQEAGAVGVKALEWGGAGENYALTETVSYHVQPTAKGDWAATCIHGEVIAPTREAAKAAAQADYEKRIRSALTPPPAQDLQWAMRAVLYHFGPEGANKVCNSVLAERGKPLPTPAALGTEPVAWKEWATQLEEYLRSKGDYEYPAIPRSLLASPSHPENGR